MRPQKYISNQFPIALKQKQVKPASWNLTYNGLDVIRNVFYGTCVKERDKLVKAGLHKADLFKFTPNY